MKIFLSILVTLAIMCSAAYAESPKEQAIEKAKEMAGELGGALKGTLLSTIKEHGFAAAISVCRDIGPSKAKEVSEKYKASIRRVTLKTRNSSNTPDDYETAILKNMEQDQAAGKLKAAYFEVITAANGKKNLRFMKPVQIENACLNCHGTPEKLNPEALKEIKRLYPDDKALGYELDQVRGAVSIIYPMN